MPKIWYQYPSVHTYILTCTYIHIYKAFIFETCVNLKLIHTYIAVVNGDAQLPSKRRGRDGGGGPGCHPGVLLPRSAARQQPHTGVLGYRCMYICMWDNMSEPYLYIR